MESERVRLGLKINQSITAKNVLELKGLTIQFGGLKAVADVSFALERRKITALIGPNGAGKTTVFNMLTGVYLPTAGDILFKGASIRGLRPHEITARGIARTFQNIRLFKDLSVLDNLRVAADLHDPSGLIASALRSSGFEARQRRTTSEAMELLAIFGMESKADEVARCLPYGQQRALELARAMATGAELLLLDEPAAGLNNQETHDLMAIIKRIRDEFGITVLLIEHDMKLVMGISEHIVVLDHGEKIAEGGVEEVRNNPKVLEAYLGRAKEKKTS